MTAAELISALLKLPQDANVSFTWDNYSFLPTNHVWLDNPKSIVISDEPPRLPKPIPAE